DVGEVAAGERDRGEVAGVGVAGEKVGRGREERDYAAVTADGGVGAGVVGLAAGAVDADPLGGAGLLVADEHVRAAAGGGERVSARVHAGVGVARHQVGGRRVE